MSNLEGEAMAAAEAAFDKHMKAGTLPQGHPNLYISWFMEGYLARQTKIEDLEYELLDAKND